MLRIPWVACGAVGRGLRGGAHGEFVHVGLADDHRPGPLQVPERLRRIGGDEIPQHPGGAGGPHPRRAQIVLDGHGDSRQRACQLSRLDAPLDFPGPLQGLFLIDRNVAVQRVLLLLYPAKGRLHGLRGRGSSRPDGGSQFHC